MELTALMTVRVTIKVQCRSREHLAWKLFDCVVMVGRTFARDGICGHRSSRYYSEAWQSDHHGASCEYSNPIREGWENQSTTWDNHTKVSLMALHDSGEVCHMVLFDAVANLSNSYLTWISWVK